MPATPTYHFAFIQRRLPQWLQAATPAQRHLLERRVRDSHYAMRRVQGTLAKVQAPETFCRDRLEQALAHGFAQLELPDVDHGWLWHEAQRRDMSWLEAGMQNFDAQEPVKLYLSRHAAPALAIDSSRFVRVVRNLDLGGLYQAHLADHLGNDTFLQQLQAQDRAAFAAELCLARLQGHLEEHTAALGDAALQDPHAAERAPLECSYLSLFDLPLSGPLLIRRRPQDHEEPCLLYLPGHPTHALRQYPSLKAAGQAITQMLWQDRDRRFFLRYVAHAEQPLFARQLRDTLYPYYPYPSLQPGTPVLEKGERVSWITLLFPSPRSLWQPTLDKNARLPLRHIAWRRDCFVERARTQRERQLQNAASIVVPVATRDAAAQLARIEGWLQIGLNVLNLASFFVPGLAEVMLVVGGAQLMDDFLYGVHAANEGDADAAISHLFAVFSGLAQFSALGAAGHFMEPQGILHDWQRIGAGHSERLWHGELSPYSRSLPAQGQTQLEMDGQFLPLQAAGKGRWRLAPSQGQRYQPAALGNGEGAWVLEHERPLAWQGPKLMRRLGQASVGLDDARAAEALRCSGYDDASLREVLADHKPIPALLLDSLETFGATPTALSPGADTQVLGRDFPGLSPRARSEILAQATSSQRAQLQRTGRLPLAMAESARLYLRQARINRALARLRQIPGDTADRDTLVFANLARLPGWTGDIRLELHENGQLRHVVGRQDAVLKRVTRYGQRYEPSDASGQVLANRGDVFHAILRALPDSERDALGLHIGDTDSLREALFELAAADREVTARQLGMAPIRPLYRLPSRLPGSARLGYALSGRGSGWQSEEALFDQLFPAAPGHDRQALRLRLVQTAGEQPGAFQRLLETLQADYQQLDGDLQAWVEQGQDAQRALRDSQAQRIRQAWRRHNPDGQIGDIDYVLLEIDAVLLSNLPALQSRMPHVRQLRISGLSAQSDNQLDAFLRAFPRVRRLDLEDNALRTLPPALAELGELQSLDLALNELDLTQPGDLDILVSIGNLEQLNLSRCLTDLPVSALQRLASAPSLRLLQLASNDLALGAEHFRALQAWPRLSHLELGHNMITLTEQSRSALAGLNRLQMLSLRHNPLELAPNLQGWTQLEQLDLENTGISHWPEGLAQLMDQTPLNLCAIDLSLNELTDAPDLQATLFARRWRLGDQELAYAFDDNPFSETALARLEQAGLPARDADAHGDWANGWPNALRVHLAQFWLDPHWQPLYELYQRLPGTQAYTLSPAAMNQRMRHVLQTLVDASQADASWGFSELQQQINDRLEDAGQECVDQASLLFQQTETEIALWRTVAHAAPGADHEQVAVDSAASLLRQSLLDERIGTLFNARRARRTALTDSHPGEAPPLANHDELSDEQLTDPTLPLDELEMALYARIQLQNALRLPTQPQGMLFDYLARLSDATLQSLADAVWIDASAPRLRLWAADQAFWPRWLQRLRPAPFEALREEWAAASEYFDTFTEAHTQPGPYTGPTVPQTYIDSLERELGEIAWREGGVLQRVDLSDRSGPYTRASALLLQGRQQAEARLIAELTDALCQGNPQAFSRAAD